MAESHNDAYYYQVERNQNLPIGWSPSVAHIVGVVLWFLAHVGVLVIHVAIGLPDGLLEWFWNDLLGQLCRVESTRRIRLFFISYSAELCSATIMIRQVMYAETLYGWVNWTETERTVSVSLIEGSGMEWMNEWIGLDLKMRGIVNWTRTWTTQNDWFCGFVCSCVEWCATQRIGIVQNHRASHKTNRNNNNPHSNKNYTMDAAANTSLIFALFICWYAWLG